MLRAVIFDFDGTIVDTFDAVVQIFNEVAPGFNLPLITDSERKGVRNLSARELVRKYQITPWKLFRLVSTIRSKLKSNIQDIPIVKEMDTVLGDLGKQGVKVGVVTTNSTENVQLFLKKWRIAVDFIHSEHNLFGKAKVLTHVIKERQLSQSSVVYVGDEVRDIEAAKKANISAIAVTWGFNSEKRLRQAEPDYVVSEASQISRIVENST